ncbi:MAG: Holliday junction branch migration protein RuvA [Candidatus Aureabacteria bacterium]|nr:Holliday junction branch migration protein RuvA [Candidatus Auribacterota bacterium]
MIDYLKGTLVAAAPNHAVIEVGGMGYRVLIPISSYEALPRPGGEVKLLTHLHHREDEVTLYGFAAEEERTLFGLLLGVSGIGPRTAITILSGVSVQAFHQAIASQDLRLLSSVRGVGKKTAERLVLELKDKISLLPALQREASKSRLDGSEAKIADVLEALLSLGYKPAQAQRAIEAALGRAEAGWAVEQLLKEALKNV